jgi:hypothetical protein
VVAVNSVQPVPLGVSVIQPGHYLKRSREGSFVSSLLAPIGPSKEKG